MQKRPNYFFLNSPKRHDVYNSLERQNEFVFHGSGFPDMKNVEEQNTVYNYYKKSLRSSSREFILREKTDAKSSFSSACKIKNGKKERISHLTI